MSNQIILPAIAEIVSSEASNRPESKNMSTSLFSKRTVAIALAAGLAVTGVQAVAPATQTGVLGAGVAAAAEASHFTLARIYDDNGDIEGPIRRAGATTAESGYRELGPNAKLEVKIGVASAKADDVVTLTPNTVAEGAKKGTSSYGIILSTSENGVPLQIDGTTVATLDSKAKGSATVTFNSEIEKFADGSLTVTLPIEIGPHYAGDVGVGNKSGSEALAADWALNVKTTGSSETEATLGERQIQTIRTTESPYLPRLDVYSGQDGTIIEGDTVRITRLDQRLPFGQNVKVELSPLIDGDYVDWNFNGEVEPQLTFWEFDDGNVQDSKISRTIEKPSEVQEIVDKYGITFTYGYNADGNLEAVVRGIEGTNLKPIISLRGDFGIGTYADGGDMMVRAVITSLDAEGNPSGAIRNVDNRFRLLPKKADGAGEGEQIRREFEAPLATIPDLKVSTESGGTAKPARIAGQTKTFIFDVKNTGNVALTDFVVTQPDGQELAYSVDPIAPGGSATIEIGYAVPEDAELLTFSVAAANAANGPFEFTFEVERTTQFIDNGDGTITIIDPEGNEMIVVSKDEADRLQKEIDKTNEALGEANDEIEDLKNRPDRHIVKAQRNEDNSITLWRWDGTKINVDGSTEDILTPLEIPAASKKGLERCLAEPGAIVLGLLPVLGLVGAALSQVQIAGLDDQVANWQKQAGLYNDDLARFVTDNRDALGSLLGALAAALILFVPGTCGELSLAGAIGEAAGSDAASSQPAAKQ